MKKITFLLILLGLSSFTLFSQSNYEKGWQSLNNANMEDAIKHFESATKDKVSKEKALLCLTLLYSHRNKEEKASEYFDKFMDISKNPYPEIYALWFENGVVGYTGQKKGYQFKLLERLLKDENNKGKLDAATDYRMLVHYLMSFDNKKLQEFESRLNNIKDWQMVGPFDNVMNSGFNKDFGPLSQPQKDATFISKYGGEVKWFDPPLENNDGYFFKDMHFRSNNSIIYAQTFIEAPTEQDVLIKLGYSGSLKVWINDQSIYEEAEHRNTEIDYYKFKCRLNKGYNRILVQLGDFEETNPNFMLRISDLSNTPLSFQTSTAYQTYQKATQSAEPIPYFAIEELQKKANSDSDLLYQILLLKAYMRSGEFDKAEAILNKSLAIAPKNYFVLRNAITLARDSKNTTNQNKFYDTFEANYKEDKSILVNDIEEAESKKENKKLKELIKTFLDQYGTPYYKAKYGLVVARIDNDNEKLLAIVDKMYKDYPKDYYSVSNKYNIEKSYYSAPEKANKILEKYLKTQYDYNVINELAGNYFNDGDIENAIKLLQKNTDLFPYMIESHRYIINFLVRQKKYTEAIKICDDLLESRPSDYLLIQDLAMLYTYKNQQDKAVTYYEESLHHFPFSFEINEKIRELKDQKKSAELIGKIDPMELIKDYEENFVAQKKQSYDVVFEEYSLIVYNSKAKGGNHRYIIKIHDEKAIEQYQNISFSAGSYMRIYFDELQTIKKNGQTIDAERRNSEAVFTNLEVGDYIYVSYYEKQELGGKSSFFISDKYNFNSFVPYYKTAYNLYVENDLPIQYELQKGKFKPVIKKNVDGFTHYQWSRDNPKMLEEESVSVPYYDIADVLHVSLDYTWKDVVQWYSDLSSHQATPDFTIKNIVKELFDGKNYTQNEKAQILYEFVCKNIQYSFVDFRQSGYIPQKASKIYHSRLGDCKDVSTLYASLARAVGIKTHLVLISTRNNGQKNVVLPSLNFNHCIVKVYLDEGPIYLELTDQDLPFGQLYYYHDGAAILEIPTEINSDEIKLSYLKLNKNYASIIERNAKVSISSDNKMLVEKQTIKTGTSAAGSVRSYYYSDEELRKDDMKEAIAKSFKSSVSLKSLSYDILEPRRDSVKYSYSYVVNNDVLKLGSLKTVKIPFADELIDMSLFEDEERRYEFDFTAYEGTNSYKETLILDLGDHYKFKETPENQHAEFNDSVYDLNFKLINENQMEVTRTYNVNRENIQPKDFENFKNFMDKVNEGENTHVLFQ